MIFVSESETDAYSRELLLLDLLDACPYCDGPVEQRSQTNPDDTVVTMYDCCDCDRRWIQADQ